MWSDAQPGCGRRAGVRRRPSGDPIRGAVDRVSGVLDLAAAYAETQARLAELVRDLPSERLATTVPASPAWDVKDVVAHLTGLAGDVLAGLIPAELDLMA